VALTTQQHLAPKLKKVYSYTPTHPLGLHGLLEGKYYFYLLLLGLLIRKDTKNKLHVSKIGLVFFYMSVTVGLACNREEHRLGGGGVQKYGTEV